MVNFVINPLSPKHQCTTSSDVYEVLARLVEAFEFILPCINRKMHRLYYDPRIDERQLKAGEMLVESLSSLPTGSDDERTTRRLWYLWTRNRSVQLEWDPHSHVTMTSQTSSLSVSGEICSAVLNDDLNWFSFGKDSLTESKIISSQVSGGGIWKNNNFFDLPSLKKYLPVYESSPKHKLKPYTDSSGDYVSPMTLNAEQAQALLLISVPEGNDLIGYHVQTDVFYKFKITRNNVYHGFEVNENEVTQRIATFLKKRQ